MMEPLRVEGLEGRDLLSLADLSKDEFAGLLTSAVQLKQNWAAGVRPAYLQHRSLALVFEKPSLRTRRRGRTTPEGNGARLETEPLAPKLAVRPSGTR